MKITSIIIIIVLSFIKLTAQDFEKGYFINKKGEKINCFIKNVDWLYNPERFEYKLNPDSEAKEASIQEVEEFGITDFSKFVKFEVLIDTSETDKVKLNQNKHPEFKNQIVFLEVVIEGKASLYKYTNQKFTRFFYKLDNEPIKQLVNKEYIRIKDGMTSILENLSYRQELLLKLNCNGVLSKKIESVRYTKNALKKLFVKYNSCENTTYTMIKPRRDFFTLGLKGSIAAQRFDLENNSVDANLEKFGYRIGVESEFLLPFNNQKWAIIFEPTYQSFNAVDTFPHKSGFGIYRVGLDYQAVDLPLGVRYYFLSGKHSKVYANIFAAQSLTFNSAFYLNNLPVFTIPDIAFTAGLGYKYNNLASVELRWNLPHSLKATLTSTKTTYSNVMLTFGFHFL